MEERDTSAPPTPSLEDVHDMLSREGGNVSFMKRLKRSTYARILMMLKESTDPDKASSFDDQMDRISEIFELIDLWVRKRDDTAGIVYDSSAHWSVGTRKSFKGKNKRAEALRVGVGMLRQKQLSLQKEKEKYVEMVSSFRGNDDRKERGTTFSTHLITVWSGEGGGREGRKNIASS